MISFLWRGRHARKLLFEHIPKCGGTSTRKYLERHYAKGATYTVYAHGEDEQRAFKGMQAPQRHGYDLIIGHGAHRLLDHAAADLVTATVLRRPVERIISHYFHAVEKPDHYLHEPVTSRGLSLADYAASGLSDELRNDMVCRFLGIGPDEAEQNPQRSVNAAWDLLRQRYQIVGVVERLDPAMEAIRAAAGLNGIWSGERRNSAKGRRPAGAISDADRRVIEEHNALDMELYRRVAEIAPR